jgi:hypothetical protein
LPRLANWSSKFEFIFETGAEGFVQAPECKPSTEFQFSFLKSNLMGRAEFRPSSVVTHLSIQGESENSPISLPIDLRRTAMTRFKILGAPAILSPMFATPVFAQAAIQEPGMFAFYYPNNDVLNGGRPTPAAGVDARTLMQLNSRHAYGAMGSSANGASRARR